jgi:2-haloalkanoic acid dehalogenase type II
MAFNLTSFKALSFDVYATLIDWESGMWINLSKLIPLVPESSPLKSQTESQQREYLLKRYNVHEKQLEHDEPKLIYSTMLARIYIMVADDIGVKATEEEAKAFSSAIGTYPAFPDTVDAMNRLGKHYKLIALSNVDWANFSKTCSGPLSGMTWDGKYLAEDIGSYKPDHNNFNYLISHAKQDFGIEPREILHTAQSLYHDHVPWKEMGMEPSVWISRGEKSAFGLKLKDVEGRVNLGGIYPTLGDMADAVEKAFAKDG